MATQNVIDGDLTVRGTFRCTSAGLPAASVGDNQFASSDPLSAAKQEHQHEEVVAQVHGTAAVTERRVLHVARGAGSVTAFRAGVVVANVGAATITVDLRKNGTTVLSAVVTLNNTHTAYTKVDGTVSVPTYVAGDVFEVVITATAGGGTLGQGLFAQGVFREAAD